MSVHKPGPRLFSSIPFKHLAQVGQEGGANVNVSLNVTPFVDMMTILVSFLLMVFSASGELISAQKGLKLPDATNKDKLKTSPIIIVTNDRVTFQGEDMKDVASLMEDDGLEWKIIELYDRLKLEYQTFERSGFEKLSSDEKAYCNKQIANPKPEEICLKGLLILQADKNTPAKVLNRVIKTAQAADYKNIMFAVNQKGSRSE